MGRQETPNNHFQTSNLPTRKKLGHIWNKHFVCWFFPPQMKPHSVCYRLNQMGRTITGLEMVPLDSILDIVINLPSWVLMQQINTNSWATLYFSHWNWNWQKQSCRACWRLHFRLKWRRHHHQLQSCSKGCSTRDKEAGVVLAESIWAASVSTSQNSNSIRRRAVCSGFVVKPAHQQCDRPGEEHIIVFEMM